MPSSTVIVRFAMAPPVYMGSVLHVNRFELCQLVATFEPAFLLAPLVVRW